MVGEFEDVAGTGTHKKYSHHLEQTVGKQVSFMKEVESLLGAFEQFGNPFLEQSSDLPTLDSKEIVHHAVIDTV